jgi:hypothetical protein
MSSFEYKVGKKFLIQKSESTELSIRISSIDIITMDKREYSLGVFIFLKGDKEKIKLVCSDREQVEEIYKALMEKLEED